MDYRLKIRIVETPVVCIALIFVVVALYGLLVDSLRLTVISLVVEVVNTIVSIYLARYITSQGSGIR